MGASKLVTAKNDTAAKESAEALLQKQVNLKISTLSSNKKYFHYLWKYRAHS